MKKRGNRPALRRRPGRGSDIRFATITISASLSFAEMVWLQKLPVGSICHWQRQQAIPQAHHSLPLVFEQTRWEGIACILFASKKNKCIRQCLHWLMQAPPGLADIIRFPSTPVYTKSKSPIQKDRAFQFELV